MRGVSGTRVTDGLNSGQVCRIFKKLARQAGLKTELASRISGHSTRIGGAQELLRDGASIAQIMAKVGWTKVDTVMRYVGLSPIEAINLGTQRTLYGEIQEIKDTESCNPRISPTHSIARAPA